MVALEGQHTAKLTNAFSKEVPSSTNRERIWGVFEAEAKSKSSVRIKTMLGLSVGASATSSSGVPDAEQLMMKRRETIRETKTPRKSALLFALQVVLSLRIIAKHLFGDRQFVSSSEASTRLGTLSQGGMRQLAFFGKPKFLGNIHPSPQANQPPYSPYCQEKPCEKSEQPPIEAL